MVLFIIFCPIVAAILIMAGVPARKTALGASALAFAATLFLLVSFDRGQHDFQHVTSFAVSPQWHFGRVVIAERRAFEAEAAAVERANLAVDHHLCRKLPAASDANESFRRTRN